MNQELPNVEAGFWKGRGTRDQIANIRQIIEKAREFQKNLFLLYWLCQRLWLCGSQQTVEILKQMGIPDHLTCLLRNLYAGQEATVRIGHGTTDWFQTGKGVHQGCLLSPCLLNLYAEYIMRNAGMDEAQAGIKIAGRNINNLRYADDTTLMAESEEEIKSLWWRWRGEWKSWFKSQHLKNKNHGIWSHHFMANRWGNSGRLYFLGLQNHCRWWVQPWN